MAKKKKWAHLRETTPKVKPEMGLEEDLLCEHLERGEIYLGAVDNELDGVTKHRSVLLKPIDNMDATIVALKAARELKSAFSAAEVAAGNIVSLITEAILNYLEDQGLERTANNDTLVTRSDDVHPKVVDHEAFIKWAKENGYEEQLTLQWQTIKSITKGQLEAENKLPDGIEIWLKQGVSARKA